MPSLRAGFGVSCKSVTLPPTGVSVPFSAPKSNTSDWAMSAFVHFWPTWSCEGHLCLTFLWSLSSCPSIGWVLQSINENSQLSSGPPRNPGCMFALKGFTGGPFKCASVERKVEWGANVHHCGGKVTAASHKASPVVTLSRIINGAEAEQELMRQSSHQQLPQMQPLQYEITVQSSPQFSPPSGFQQTGERRLVL